MVRPSAATWQGLEARSGERYRIADPFLDERITGFDMFGKPLHVDLKDLAMVAGSGTNLTSKVIYLLRPRRFFFGNVFGTD